MKISIRDNPSHLAFLAILLMTVASCNKMPSVGGQGTLSWRFSPVGITRSTVAMPDTDAFILIVTNSAKTVIYNGPYGDSPESILVNPGTYTIRVVSREFSAPEFEAPQFGDEQVVVVKAGAGTQVSLECSQLNCGLRLLTGDDFQKVYPGGSLRVSSAEGTLDYAAGERRMGYFLPGELKVSLNGRDGLTVLTARTLEARQMLTLRISCPQQVAPDGGSASGGLSIKVDTLRTWDEGDLAIGGDSEGGTTIETAYSAAQVKDHAGEKGVWICGYIVGGDLSSSKNGISFEPPFESLTCIAIAARSSVSEKSSCVAVQLAKGSIREALNLVGNPGLLGRKVYLKGDIEQAYYGLPGIKNLSEYSFN